MPIRKTSKDDDLMSWFDILFSPGMLLVFVLIVILCVGFYAILYDDVNQCMEMACPAGFTPNYINGECVCFVMAK